ncbi:MAG: radical SAM protein [Rhodospirillaceae bacterium]|nr:radical SAM protein [Rhodospirillales bacterium]
MHGYTGAYDRVSRRVGDYLKSLETARPPKSLIDDNPRPEPGSVAPPTDETIATLKARGYLTDLSEEEERARLLETVTRLHETQSRAAPIYLIMPTYDCNLRCGYCFQSELRCEGHVASSLHMDTAMADRILSALPRIEAEHHPAIPEGTPRNIGFFGGEPLLAANRIVVEQVMTGARAMGPARFWAVTNGTELDAYDDLLGPDDIATIQITLDGPPAEHDRRRIYPDGSGSFERITRNIGMALDKGVAVQVRVNVDRNNIAELPAIARAVTAFGWQSNPRFDLHTAPITASNAETDRKTTFTTRGLADALTDLMRDFPEMRVFRRQDQSMKTRARRIFTGQSSPTDAMKTCFCNAHDRMYVIDPFGDVYACWEQTGNPATRMGRIAEDGSFHTEATSHCNWRTRSAVSNPTCLRCRFLLHCGGGCAVQAERAHGRFFTNFCDEFGVRFRQRVAEAYLEHTAGMPETGTAAPVCSQ